LTKAMLHSPRSPRKNDSFMYAVNSSQYLSEDEFMREDEELIKIDQSNQVSPSDLKSNMKDDETQMTPPLSPLKQIKLQLVSSVRVDMSDMATETDEFFPNERRNSLLIVEEKTLPIMSSSTQTFAEVECEDEAPGKPSSQKTTVTMTDVDSSEAETVGVDVGQEVRVANQSKDGKFFLGAILMGNKNSSFRLYFFFLIGINITFCCCCCLIIYFEYKILSILI
jgi:hypothetical protein